MPKINVKAMVIGDEPSSLIALSKFIKNKRYTVAIEYGPDRSNPKVILKSYGRRVLGGRLGDYLVKLKSGNMTLCKPDDFNKTYKED